MIKNYTSAVPIERTIMRIEGALIRGGAIGISKEYKGGELEAIHFSIPGPENRLMMIRLPGDIKAVYEVLLSKMRRPRPETLRRLQEQSARTAWKIVQEWVEVQMSFIEMRQAEFLQIFLPFMWDGSKTLYLALKATGFKMLEGGFKMLPEGKSGEKQRG
jgi:hypothetical protein